MFEDLNVPLLCTGIALLITVVSSFVLLILYTKKHTLWSRDGLTIAVWITFLALRFYTVLSPNIWNETFDYYGFMPIPTFELPYGLFYDAGVNILYLFVIYLSLDKLYVYFYIYNKLYSLLYPSDYIYKNTPVTASLRNTLIRDKITAIIVNIILCVIKSFFILYGYLTYSEMFVPYHKSIMLLIYMLICDIIPYFYSFYTLCHFPTNIMENKGIMITLLPTNEKN
ncbi:hypothetical protein WA158_006619 [Blastocystis sp. Blastoise]